MPYYDFYCRECKKGIEEFFKIADDKIVECTECGNHMEQVILKAPGLRDPGGTGRRWTNDGYQMRDEKSGKLRTVKEKWEKGKNVIRDDVHKSDPGSNSNQNAEQQLKSMIGKTDHIKTITRNDILINRGGKTVININNNKEK